MVLGLLELEEIVPLKQVKLQFLVELGLSFSSAKKSSIDSKSFIGFYFAV